MSHSCDETYAIYDEREFRANKPHVCDACGVEIRKRDRYTRVFMLFDGSKEHLKRCARCQLLHEHLRGLCEPGEEWPAERLDCGLSYESEWGAAPDWIAALAFWRPGDPLPATNPCTPHSSPHYQVAGRATACWTRWGVAYGCSASHTSACARGWGSKLSGKGTEVCL
jgi:predicted RNA-binding Zn-ribbon protein involved in translation (DUF1610 family)